MEEYTFFPTETQVLSCFSVAHMGHRNKCFFRSFFKRSKSKAFSLQVKCPNAMTDLAPFPPLYAIHHYFCVWSKKCSHKSSKENPGYALLWFKSINELFSPEFFLILIKWKFGLKTGSWRKAFLHFFAIFIVNNIFLLWGSES